MANLICWICSNNLAYKKYEGTKLLDEDGNKPCYECLIEDDALNEEEADGE